MGGLQSQSCSFTSLFLIISNKMSCASSLLVIVLFGLVSQTWTQGFRFGSGTFGSSSTFGSSNSTFGSSNSRFGSSSSSFGSSSGNGDYIASWDHGANSLTWLEGKRWCQSRGRRLVSLDSSSKADRYFNILGSENRPYFWSGGFKTVSSPSLSGEIVRWENGNTQSVFRGSFPWSTHGQRGPQPDGGSQEECIAVLNISFYPDGPHLHDVSCDHR